jgi:hypothetical protein
MEDATKNQNTFGKSNPPESFAKLYAKKTTHRANAIVPADNFALQAKQQPTNPSYPEFPTPKQLGRMEQLPHYETLDQQFREASAYGQHSEYTNNWQKVRKGENDTIKDGLGVIMSMLKGFSLKKLVPVTVGVSILLGGFMLLKSVTTSSQGTGFASSAMSVNDAARLKDEVKNELLEEQRDQQITESMEFLKQASTRYKSAPTGDVPLIDDANQLRATQVAIRNNMNLYTTIYLHNELVVHHLDILQKTGVDNNDLRATMFSLYELEQRAYDNIREIQSMLDQLDALYDGDRGRKLELRVMLNQAIVQLNQTNAEVIVLIKRLDKFFVN